MAKKEKSSGVVSPIGRLSYPHLFKPSGNAKRPDAPKKYSCSLLVEKDEDLSDITSAIKQAKIDKWGADKSKWPKKLRSPIADGDGEDYEDNPECHGHWVLKCSTGDEYRPVVADAKNRLLDEKDKAKVYAGCYGIVNVKAFAYSNESSGVSLILNGFQKVRDGEPLGSRQDPKTMFGPAAGLDAEDDMDDDELPKGKKKKKVVDEDDDLDDMEDI